MRHSLKDAVILPMAILAEIRNPDGGLLVSQRFRRKNEQLSLDVKLSPTGKEAALIWGEWSQEMQQFSQSGRIVSLFFDRPKSAVFTHTLNKRRNLVMRLLRRLLRIQVFQRLVAVVPRLPRRYRRGEP